MISLKSAGQACKLYIQRSVASEGISWKVILFRFAINWSQGLQLNRWGPPTLWKVWSGMKRQNDMTLKDELPRSVGTQYVTEEEWRYCSRRNEEAEPKWKQCPVMDMSGGKSKLRCCKEQYCVRIWNVRSMNQGKLEVVKQEGARVNMNILGNSELSRTRMGKFHTDDHYIYYCGQESLIRNGVTLIADKSPKCSIWVQSQKQQNNLCLFPRQTIQYHSTPVYAWTTNAKVAEAEWFCEDRPTRPSRTNTQKRCAFHQRGPESESRKSRDTWSNRQVWPWCKTWSRAKANRALPREHTCQSKHPFPRTPEKTLHMDITRWTLPKSGWLYSLQPEMEKLYIVRKSKTGNWLWLRPWTPSCQIQT